MRQRFLDDPKTWAHLRELQSLPPSNSGAVTISCTNARRSSQIGDTLFARTAWERDLLASLAAQRFVVRSYSGRADCMKTLIAGTARKRPLLVSLAAQRLVARS